MFKWGKNQGRLQLLFAKLHFFKTSAAVIEINMEFKSLLKDVHQNVNRLFLCGGIKCIFLINFLNGTYVPLTKLKKIIYWLFGDWKAPPLPHRFGSSFHSHLLREPAEATLLTPKWTPNTQDRAVSLFPVTVTF